MTHFGKYTNFTKTPTCKSMKNCNQSYDLNFTNKPWHKFRSITVTVIFCQQRIGDISIQCGTLYRRWAAESFVNTIILHLCLHLTHILLHVLQLIHDDNQRKSEQAHIPPCSPISWLIHIMNGRVYIKYKNIIWIDKGHNSQKSPDQTIEETSNLRSL